MQQHFKFHKAYIHCVMATQVKICSNSYYSTWPSRAACACEVIGYWWIYTHKQLWSPDSHMTRPPNETLITMERSSHSTSSCSIFSNKLKKKFNYWNSFLTFMFTYYASAITRQRVRSPVLASDSTHQEKWPGLEILPPPRTPRQHKL